eukprot:8936178-Pyramimonas_sp.AAC.2
MHHLALYTATRSTAHIAYRLHYRRLGFHLSPSGRNTPCPRQDSQGGGRGGNVGDFGSQDFGKSRCLTKMSVGA